ncbi:MAG: acyclic terpene utilization AtuA family protein [Leptonema sp. (in: bacteria)]
MTLKKNKKVLIANAGGFWGDDPLAFKKQILGGTIHYITMDYLAEVTMSILRKQQIKNPELGYISDVIQLIKENAEILIKKNIKIITNAGGLNPIQCGEKILEILKQSSLDSYFKIGVVTGDNIYPEIFSKFKDYNFIHLDDQKILFKEIQKKLQIANVYFGANPIVEALKEGANIVITGRVTDAALVMAPLIYEFGWQSKDFDLLASALVAGHLIECGTQVSGGNFTDWKLIKNWDLGYPIVEAYENGEFIVKKHPKTGGRISENTIKEQLLYEIQDPNNYISPDVIADFNTIQLEKIQKDKVRIKNVKGKPPTPYYKVSMGYKDGFKVSAELILSGPEVLKKSKICKEIILSKLKTKYERINFLSVGYNSCHRNLIQYKNTNEVLLRVIAHHPNKEELEELTRVLPSIILSAPPGISVTGGRQKVSEVIAYYPTLIPKAFVEPKVTILNATKKELVVASLTGLEKEITLSIPQTSKDDPKDFASELMIPRDNKIKVSFLKICLARSGDKGDNINLGVIARNQFIYDYLEKHLTADYIKFLFKAFTREVLRYEIPNLLSFNFILKNSLEGGGTRSIEIDAQGKTIAQAFLNQYIYIPKSILLQR